MLNARAMLAQGLSSIFQLGSQLQLSGAVCRDALNVN